MVFCGVGKSSYTFCSDQATTTVSTFFFTYVRNGQRFIVDTTGFSFKKQKMLSLSKPFAFVITRRK